MQKKAKMQKKSRNARKKQKMHVRFQNSCKKEQKCKKKAENAFQFENSCKKGQKQKKESTFIWILFAFISLVHFKPKNSYKKRQKCKKKAKKFFQIAKIHMQKKSMKYHFKKTCKKKA